MFEYSGIRLKWPRERPSRRHWAMGQGTEGPDILRLDLNIPRAMQEEAIEVIEKVGWYKMNQNDTKVIDMVIDMRDSHLWIRKCLKYLKHLKYLKYIPSTTKCLIFPLGINSRVLEWGSRAILDSRPLTLPHCRPLEVLIPGVFFFLNVVVYYFRPPRIFMDHVEVDTWKAWCPLFWELSKVPGILVIGKCTIFGVGFLRVFMALCGYLRHFTALLSLAEHGAPKDEVPFLCVRRFMFTWAMDHGYEIIALAAQLPEPKHAKCINAD